MTYTDLTGLWINEFGSQMMIYQVDQSTGFLVGEYSSHTGATGTYLLTGITDNNPAPNVNSQTIVFNVSWRNIDGPNDNTQYWVSGFSGQYQLIDNEPIIVTTYLLVENTDPSNDWGSTIIDKSTFKKQQNAVLNNKRNLTASFPNPPTKSATTQSVLFWLTQGKQSDNGATPWFSQIGVGTPAQALRMMIDTGTDNTWLTSSACTTPACAAHKSFNNKNSSSFVMIDAKPSPKSFGPWGTMIVQVGSDKFTLQLSSDGKHVTGSTAESMNFELAVFYNGDQFQQLDADGGIAIPSPYWVKTPNTESLLLQLLNSGDISYPVASFGVNTYMGLGVCLFGAIDPDFFNPSTLQWLQLKPVKTVGLEYLWNINLNGFYVNGSAVQAGITDFILDTGSSYFKGPADLIGILQNAVTYNGQLPQTVTDPDNLSLYPNIVLSIGNQNYTITPQQYFLELAPNNWLLGIQVLDGMPEGMLLVGSVFLDTVYSIFDYQWGGVGLARLN